MDEIDLLKRALANKDFALMAAAREREEWRNTALEEAAQACEKMLTYQGDYKGDGPNAARRMCALKIRELKTVPLRRGGQ